MEIAEFQAVFMQSSYLVAAALFILGLRGLTDAETSRRGIVMAEIGMLAAVIGTLVGHVPHVWHWIIVGLLVGSLIGTAMGLWIPMTKMPERIALSHAFGGLAVALVGVVVYTQNDKIHAGTDTLGITATGFEVFLGALTFTGSLVAFGKLQGILPGAPLTFPGQNRLNVGLFFATIVGIVVLVLKPELGWLFWVTLAMGFALGLMLVLPIGGADMPVVICLLNSYAGLAASATGFALNDNVLIICGALDGGSGFVLAMAMSKAMNRSFANVLFAAVGKEVAGPAAGAGAPAAIPNEASVDDAAEVLRAARSVIVIPGYGMAVSQAQHAVRDMANVLAANQCTVRYAIHPVAGRMPGHMNVLLAEANIPYDQLYDLDQINDDFPTTDVALVVGANDVVNPAAKTDQSSPIYGMPIFNCEAAATVIVLKRSMNPGFAGVENALFVKPNTMMVLGDAKKTLMSLTSALKS
jgi:NAD(P) transhydrogenase subunit beta